MSNLADLDRFAEALAEGASLADAAKAAGREPKAGPAMLMNLRRRLGWQAR